MQETEQLVELQNGEPTTTSLQVAKVFNVRHRNVLRDVRKAIDKLEKLERSNLSTPQLFHFQETTYTTKQNKQAPMFLLNKNTMVLVTSTYTTDEAMSFKAKYITQFDTMYDYIQEQQQTQFFAPETVEQQIRREQLAIAKQNSDNAKSREVRSWLKLTKNDPEAVKVVAPKVTSILLDMPEEQLQIEPKISYLYTAADIGKMLGIEAYDIGSIAQKLDLKATREEGANRYTKNVMVKDYTGELSSKWLYSHNGYCAIADYLDSQL